ncbi:hypothetical protein RB614_40720 [Phytohabitans sp. ZYX-F-186]|uniref:Uncharacterized protein n=1 Tax=Phytohabitans maris TaxID=3071409 RepID=A0ABU0ZXA4_9ACTN|nr:hypothetical protein [Phytohabitans sp. ZYX-F-186]MDQ7910835.1 hypothetical protein [Phytohabitans sp. ZYX-F-186]
MTSELMPMVISVADTPSLGEENEDDEELDPQADANRSPPTRAGTAAVRPKVEFIFMQIFASHVAVA